MAEDKYKTPPKMQEIYDKDKADHETHDTEMKEAAGDPEDDFYQQISTSWEIGFNEYSIAELMIFSNCSLLIF
mgnify:CR=1 FL=1